MAAVISMINLKGGVGKTTTTVAVAQMLSGAFGRRVLVVDLDPQTNATVMLIGEKGWDAVNRQGRTIARLFLDGLRGERRFALATGILHGVGGVGEVRSLSLLPSSLDLIQVQESFAQMQRGAYHEASPVDILKRALRPVMGTFDYVLVDCPPSLGLLTLNGLRMSDGFVVPTIPDVLSTYGIAPILNRVRMFGEVNEQRIEPLGIVVSKYRQQSALHVAQLHQLAAQNLAPLFDTVIPESNDIAAAAEYRPVSTLRQKWGYRTYEAYRALTAEIVQKVEARAWT
jgi:chromosome partitioning protein